MKVKKILAAVLALMMIASLAACGKRSAAGHPHHPLYLRADAVPEPFDVAAYAAAGETRAAAAARGRRRRI